MYLLYICIVGVISLIVVFALDTTVRKDIEQTNVNINSTQAEINNNYNQKVQLGKDDIRYRSTDLLLKEVLVEDVKKSLN